MPGEFCKYGQGFVVFVLNPTYLILKKNNVSQTQNYAKASVLKVAYQRLSNSCSIDTTALVARYDIIRNMTNKMKMTVLLMRESS